MAAALIALKGVYLPIAIPVAAAAYFATLVMVKGVGKDELKLVKAVMHNEKADK